MTKKDLFRIIIKLFGLLILVNSILMFLGQFGLFIATGDWLSVLMLFVGVLLTCGLISLLVFFPDIVINIFKLDKGFDDNKINLTEINARLLIELGVLIIGGFFILYGFAPLLISIGYKVYYMADRLQMFSPPTDTETFNMLKHAVELTIGLLLIFNYRRIAGFILSINKTNETQ